MSERFFAFRLILHFGAVAAVVPAQLRAAGVAVLWPINLRLALTLSVAAVAFVLFKSYVEMVSIVFSMVH